MYIGIEIEFKGFRMDVSVGFKKEKEIREKLFSFFNNAGGIFTIEKLPGDGTETFIRNFIEEKGYVTSYITGVVFMVNDYTINQIISETSMTAYQNSDIKLVLVIVESNGAYLSETSRKMLEQTPFNVYTIIVKYKNQ